MTRQLKITELTQSGRSGEVPQLRINGKWLAGLGFKIGEMVRITTREKLLVIEPIEEETKL
jgi:toxic protein SymE